MLSFTNIVRSALLLASLLPAVRSETFEVIVGGPGTLKYTPEFVDARVGDEIRFVFRQKNHTATQSTFENPCQRAPGGFDSSFWFVPETQTSDFPVALLPITSTNPIWVYCRQGNHCQQGMVFAVNPGDRLEAFKAAATGGIAPIPSTPASGTSAVPSPTSASGTASGTASPSPSTSAPAAGRRDHKVVVGGAAGLVFEPSNVAAQPGDTITFEFRQKNHTVTQSTFDNPCVANPSGFDSGYRFVEATATQFPSYTISVNDTRPAWAYCAQGNHCAQGMVFAINPATTGERTFAAFQEKARGGAGAGANTGAPASGAVSRQSFTGAGAALAAVILSAFFL